MAAEKINIKNKPSTLEHDNRKKCPENMRNQQVFALYSLKITKPRLPCTRMTAAYGMEIDSLKFNMFSHPGTPEASLTTTSEQKVSATVPGGDRSQCDSYEAGFRIMQNAKVLETGRFPPKYHKMAWEARKCIPVRVSCVAMN